jgi:hypothetical protein
VDFWLLKQQIPDLSFVLFQLESQLGGDYSELNATTIGSPATRTLLSYFNLELDIITMLKGERKVDRPIHKTEYFKELTIQSLERAEKTFRVSSKNTHEARRLLRSLAPPSHRPPP